MFFASFSDPGSASLEERDPGPEKECLRAEVGISREQAEGTPKEDSEEGT